MKNLKIATLFLFLFLFCSFSVNAQNVIGKWKTFDDKTGEAKSIVEITERNGKIYGKVIQILVVAKKDVKCQNCSGVDKDKPVLGLEILKGLTKDGSEYSNGKILDPSNGKLYKCTVTANGTTKLDVRGYIGISAFGRTQTWTKVE